MPSSRRPPLGPYDLRRRLIALSGSLRTHAYWAGLRPRLRAGGLMWTAHAE